VILDESWLATLCDDSTLVAMNTKVKGSSINRDDFVVLQNAQIAG
jgi:hypothetical protein